jgi:hypothetical protein
LSATGEMPPCLLLARTRNRDRSPLWGRGGCRWLHRRLLLVKDEPRSGLVGRRMWCGAAPANGAAPLVGRS